MTSQRASCPQVPGHGSTHLFLMQALSLLHSALITHSGLHDSYGLPIYSGGQLHTPLSHNAFGPQGDGLQRSSGNDGSVTGGLRVHCIKGSPVYPSSQVQIGI